MQLITYLFNTLCTIPCVPLAIYHDSATDAWVPCGDMAPDHRAERCGLGRSRPILILSGQRETEQEKGKGAEEESEAEGKRERASRA